MNRRTLNDQRQQDTYDQGRPHPQKDHQEHMQSSVGEGAAWSPSEADRMNRSKTYFQQQSSGVDGIIGKLGRLEAMIMAQGNGKRKKEPAAQKQAYPLKATTIDRIIYPVYTKKGLKYAKPKRPKQPLPAEEPAEPQGKLLDGFLILYSCRVKLPHEAIKSKLASQKIVEVIEEDLCYF